MTRPSIVGEFRFIRLATPTGPLPVASPPTATTGPLLVASPPTATNQTAQWAGLFDPAATSPGIISLAAD